MLNKYSVINSLKKKNKTLMICNNKFTGEKVMIKIYKQGFEANCENERKVLSHIKSKRAPKLIEAIEDHINIISYVEGETLDQLIRKNIFGKDYALEITRQICMTLEEINLDYKHDIVHCDLKPSHIILNQGKAYIIDFENAVMGGDDPIYSNYGTIGYAAPEQYGLDSISHETDIYAIGVMLYEMIATDKNTYSDFSIDQNNYITLDLKSIVRNCTEHKKCNRYDNVSSLINDIKLVNNFWKQTC